MESGAAPRGADRRGCHRFPPRGYRDIATNRVILREARFFIGVMDARRIGFAYNQKPQLSAEADEDPPSSAGPSHGALPHSDTPGAGTPLDDVFAEWDDPATIAAVEAALRTRGQVIRLEARDTFPAALAAARPDIVFNIAEGLRGVNREGHVPAICEFYGIPHTASDALTLGLALDKRRAKEIFLARGIPTASWAVLEHGAEAFDALAGDDGPWIVKPLLEGSSKGIPEAAFCTDVAAVARRVDAVAAAYEQAALVEAFLPGREFTAAVLGNGTAARVLPLVEIRFDALPAGALPLYGYEAKWVWDTTEVPLPIFACPAVVEPPLADALMHTALQAYHALGCRDWARVDLRLDALGTPNVIEVNPLPGILPDPRQNSCFPKAARAAGLSYEALIVSVLDAALARYGMAS